MKIRNESFFSKLLIGISVTLLCLLTCMDDITGSLKAFSIPIPLIQSAGGQDENEDRKAVSNYVYTTGSGRSYLSLSLAFSKVCPAEEACQACRIYSEYSHYRAPPLAQV